VLIKLRKDKRQARNTHIAPKVQRGIKRRGLLFPLERVKSTSAMVLLALAGGGLLAGLALGSLHLYRYATSNPIFATKTVNIAGNVRLQRDEVLELSGVHLGENSLAVSIAGMEKAISLNPWIEEVAVKRVLPDRFDIRLRERSPWFWVQNGDLLFYADEQGRPIAPVESSNFLSLPTLDIQAGAEDLAPNM